MNLDCSFWLAMNTKVRYINVLWMLISNRGTTWRLSQGTSLSTRLLRSWPWSGHPISWWTDQWAISNMREGVINTLQKWQSPKPNHPWHQQHSQAPLGAHPAQFYHCKLGLLNESFYPQASYLKEGFIAIREPPWLKVVFTSEHSCAQRCTWEHEIYSVLPFVSLCR